MSYFYAHLHSPEKLHVCISSWLAGCLGPHISLVLHKILCWAPIQISQENADLFEIRNISSVHEYLSVLYHCWQHKFAIILVSLIETILGC
jgi:hypothetical protein